MQRPRVSRRESEDFQPGGKDQAAGEKCATDNREDLNLADNQASMIACAWTLKSEVRLFKQFHFVLCVDGPQDTNKECRPMVTGSAKDTEDNWHVVIRIILPSERSWTFRWIFQSVLPALLGKHVLVHIRIIITDGDSQEIAQVDNAMVKHCPNAIRLRCHWHIFDRGLLHHNPRRVPQEVTSDKDKQPYKEVRKKVCDWMFTLADDS